MTFLCIADTESSLGFKLAGVETREVSTRPEALEALEVAMAMEDLGIILVTERVSAFIREELDRILYQNKLPLILEIPSRGEFKKRKTASEFLKDAIGISI